MYVPFRFQAMPPPLARVDGARMRFSVRERSAVKRARLERLAREDSVAPAPAVVR